MAGISDKIKSVIDYLVGPIGGEETELDGTEDVFGTLKKDLEGEGDYEVVDNTALQPKFKPASRKDRGLKVVPMANRASHEVVVYEPRAYNESISIVEALKERKTVILNLQLLDREQSQRIVDFLCGCTHALDGKQRKIGDFVFIFTPSNIELTQEMVNSKLALDARWNASQTL